MSTINDNKVCTFLTFGKPGAGKSSFLNSVSRSNHFKTSSFGKSCTKEVISYQIQINDTIFLLIDVPGFGDTDGDDQKNMDDLTCHLKNLDHGLNSIVIVITSSDYRLDGNIQNSLKFLYNFFGDGNFWYHVCIVVTHCSPYQEDVDELKQSLTTGEDSLKSIMLQMIKDVCYLDEDPDIPFFFVDSKHPDNYPSKESLPEFIKWLKSCDSFETKNLEMKDVNWQYQEIRHEIKTKTSPKNPIYKFVPGEPQMITVEEDVPYVEIENKVREIEREYIEWVDRKWDKLDKWLIGIPRLFRKNKVKETRKEIIKENYVENVVKYKKELKTIFSGVLGENQKLLKGYYQDVTTVIETYTACWSYNCKPEDIRNKTNPLKRNSTLSIPEITTHYFDPQSNELDQHTQNQEIEELKSFKE